MKVSSTSSPLIDEISSLYGSFMNSKLVKKADSFSSKWLSILKFLFLCLMQRWLVGQVVTAEKIRQAKDFYQLHFGYNLFNEEGRLCHATYVSDIFNYNIASSVTLIQPRNLLISSTCSIIL